MKRIQTKVAWGILLTLLLSCISSNTALAQVTFHELSTVPGYIGGVTLEDCTHVDAEIPPQAAVAAEVRHLEETLPSLAGLDVPVYTVRQRCILPGFGMLAGCTLSGKKAVYLFASPRYCSYTIDSAGGVPRMEPFGPYLAAYTVAHEFGHVVRYQLVNDRTLQEYLKLRGVKANENQWSCHPEEVFAEDFRWLFGSENARHVPYLCSIKPPGEKEKQFILAVLTGE
ncbi:MAG: hypothetical protein AB1426_06535 [Bacillota bacterium]